MVKKITDHTITKMSGEITKLSLQTLLFILLPLIVFTLITARTEVLKGMRSFVVITGSMEPRVPVGSIIYTKNELGYKVGDVIAFKNAEGKTITHRIVGMDFKDNTLYQTKGDANNAKDIESVSADKVIGKIYLLVPHVGNLMNFIKTPRGFVILIAIPVAIFTAFELWNIKKELEKEIEKKMLTKFQKQSQITNSTLDNTISLH